MMDGVNVVDSQDFLLASGARVCKSWNCKTLLTTTTNTKSNLIFKDSLLAP